LEIFEDANKDELMFDSNRNEGDTQTEVTTRSKSYPDRRDNFMKDDENFIFRG